jgi:PKD repeat protein
VIVVLAGALLLGGYPVVNVVAPSGPALARTGSASTPSVAFDSSPSAGAFPPPNWRLLNVPGPSPVPTDGSLAFLPASDDVVWVGGAYRGAVQTWEFAAGNWTNVSATATGAPPANPGGRLAAAPFRNEVAWTSPYLGATSMGLWTFSNGTWTNDSALSPAPPARVDGSWATDHVDGTIVLFGGESDGFYLNDTWSLNGSGWTAIATTSAPTPRADAGLGAPGSTTALVLTGGAGPAGGFNDTWTFSAGAWTLVPRAGAPFGLSYGANALTSTPGGDVLAFGGVGCASPNGLCNDTFEYAPTLGRWSNVSSQYAPSPRAGLELTYDAASGFGFAFGGAIGAADPSPQSWAIGGPVVNALVVTPTTAQPPSLVHFLSYAGGGYGTYTYLYHGQNVDCVSKNLSNDPCLLDNDDTGNYTVISELTDQLGNVTNASAPFHVLPALLVETTLSAATVDVGQPVNFSMTVSAPSVPIVIRWQDLPADCPFTNQSSFNCTSFDPGFYGVSCVVTDQYGATSTSSTLPLAIATAPSVLDWPSVTAGIAPLTVTFQSNVTGGTGTYVYNWSYGDGSHGTGAAPTHTFTTNGTFQVNLTVSDTVGYVASSRGAILVTVAPALVASISASATSWVAPATVELSAGAAGGSAPYTYRWTLGNGQTAAQATVTASYAAAGSYPVAVVVVDAHGLVATASSVVTVTPGNATSGTGGGGMPSTPAWELPAIGAAGVVAGLLVGLMLGRRRPGGRSDRSHDA